jgi:hypothetical protein
MNILVFLTFYSPIIIATSILSLSFIFQNFKGIIFLAFLIGVSILRNFIYMVSGSLPNVSTRDICSSIQYSPFGNSGFSIFILAFTTLYLCLPMFLNKDVNFWVSGGLIFYLSLTIFIQYSKGCLTKLSDIFINILTGAALGTIIPSLLYLGGSSKYLFFNEISSNKEICSMPKKQQFKCSVYKNGELLSSSTTN